MDIKKTFRLMTSLTLTGVMGCTKRHDGKFLESLPDMHFVTRSIATSKQLTEITIQVLNEEPLYKYLAGEAHRHLLASRITLHRSHMTQPENASWQLIEHYYAAFYAINYLIRLTGSWTSHLDQPILDCIHNAYQGPERANKGIFQLSYDPNTQMLKLSKAEKGTSGGSHQEVWESWNLLVSRLHANTLTDPIEYAREGLDLLAHKKAITRSTGHYMPSSLRSEINYQFKNGTWHFENQGPIVARAHGLLIPEPPTQVSTSQVEQFFKQNQIIIDIAKYAADHVTAHFPRSIVRSLKNQYKNYF